MKEAAKIAWIFKLDPIMVLDTIDTDDWLIRVAAADYAIELENKRNEQK